MADLVTKLILDNKQFDDSIAQSKQQVKDFDGITQGIGQSIKSLAGMFGLAMGAAEIFEKTISATRDSEEAFEKFTAQGSAAVDTFFNALSRGDFSNFISGLKTSIKQAGILADAINKLDETKLFNDFQINNLETKRNEYLNKSRDKTLSPTERNKNLGLAENTEKQINNRKQELAGNNSNVFYNGIRSLLAKGGYSGVMSNNVVEYAFSVSGKEREERSKKYDKNIKYYEAQKNKHTSYEVEPNGQQEVVYDNEYYNILKRENVYKAKSGDKIFKILQNTNENELKKFTQYKETANQMTQDISNGKLELDNVDAKINGSYAKQHKVAKTKKVAVGKTNGIEDSKINSNSLNEIDKKIADTRKQYNNAATQELRAKLFELIKDLESYKITLNFEANYGTAKKYPKLKEPTNDPLNAEAGANITDLKSVKLNKINTPITSKNLKLNNDYIKSLDAISNMMGAISNITKKGASQWITYGATIISTVASAIPAITALLAIKKTEAVVNGISSASETPVVGWILAAAGAASVIAAIASIPSFATGGIVPGSDYTGDKVLTRLNSGEMVLNKSQQGNLYGLVNSSNNNQQNNSTTQVQFKIAGKDLVGAISNYNTKISKVK